MSVIKELSSHVSQMNTREVTTDTLLENIFSRFCIGK